MVFSERVSVHGSLALDPQRTPYDSIFRFVCWAHGLDIGIFQTRCSKMMQRMLLVLRSVMFACGMPLYFLHRTAPGREFSFAKITSDLGGFLFLGFGFYAASVIMGCRVDIQDLLQKSGRRVQHIALPALCALPAVAYAAETFASGRGLVPKITEVLCMHTKFTMISFFMIYTDMLATLQHRNREILESIQAGHNSDCSIPAKWKLRDAIGTMNCIFGRTLALFYIESFMAAIHTFSTLGGSSHDSRERVVLLSNVVGIVLQLLVLAVNSSALVATSLRCEYHLSKVFRPDSSIELLVFKLRDEWDLPKVGYVFLNVSNFLKFLASAVTCIAVILQFDHRVLRKLNSMAAFLATAE